MVKIPTDIVSVPTAENFLPQLLLDSFITNMQLEFQRASNSVLFLNLGNN